MDGYRLKGVNYTKGYENEAQHKPQERLNFSEETINSIKSLCEALNDFDEIIEERDGIITDRFHYIKEKLEKGEYIQFKITKLILGEIEEFNVLISTHYLLDNVIDDIKKFKNITSKLKEIVIRKNTNTGSPVFYLVKKLYNSKGEVVKTDSEKLFDFISIIHLLEAFTYGKNDSIPEKEQELYEYIESIKNEKFTNLTPVREALDYLILNKPNMWQLTSKNKFKDIYFKEVKEILIGKLLEVSKDEVCELYVD